MLDARMTRPKHRTLKMAQYGFALRPTFNFRAGFGMMAAFRLRGIMPDYRRLRAVVREIRQKRPFVIDAWVVLPDHLHCVWTLPPGDDDFTNRWRLIKQGFSKTLPITERRSAIRRARGERGI
jgi:hypothetical protein